MPDPIGPKLKLDSTPARSPSAHHLTGAYVLGRLLVIIME